MYILYLDCILGFIPVIVIIYWVLLLFPVTYIGFYDFYLGIYMKNILCKVRNMLSAVSYIEWR